MGLFGFRLPIVDFRLQISREHGAGRHPLPICNLKSKICNSLEGIAVRRGIRLKGLNGSIKDRCWESSDLLRIGRLDPLEIVLDDSSVSRYHAEIRRTERGWRIRDLGSTNGTRLNGVR